MMLSNGGPPLDPDNVPNMRVIRVHINDWVASTRGMNLDEEGFFWRFTCLLYDRMGNLPDDDRINARALNLDIRQYRNMKKRMVSLGKISLDDGRLTNARAEREINSYLAQYKHRSDAAKEREHAKRMTSNRVEISPTSASKSGQVRGELRGNVGEMSVQLRPELTADVSENGNENNDDDTTPLPNGDHSPHARARPKPKPKPLREVLPPTPLSGREEGGSQAPSAEQRSKPPQCGDDLEAACAAYNDAAEKFGFSRCVSFTTARRKRLAARLTDIGGVERFLDALRALALKDTLTDILLGKAKPKHGGPPFRLDIDVLLRPDGSFGDILARLLDVSTAHEALNCAPQWMIGATTNGGTRLPSTPTVDGRRIS